MGLMDILNGMQNGPRGESQPGEGGMSKMTMALLALLAWKAYKSYSGQPHAAPAPAPQLPGAPTQQAGAGGGLFGGLGNLLPGGLGGLLGGAAAGGVLSGGLNDLLKTFQDAGHGDAANSWVGTGQNQPISPGAIENALGGEKIEELLRQTGLNKDELLKGLSTFLPDAINHLTPDGRVPTEHEIGQRL